MVLGPIPAARYESATTALDPGDLLLLYTDGISERVKSSGDFFGADRIDFRASMLLNEPASQVAAGGDHAHRYRHNQCLRHP